MIPRRGQIVWIDFNPRAGHEQSGRRPAVVISPREYNAMSSCLLVAPIISNIDPWPWKVQITSGQVRGAILIDQIKSIDGAARHIELTEQELNQNTLEEALARLATLTS